MKAAAVACLLLGVIGTCFAQGEKPLCPKHIEAPSYPQIAHAVHVTGTVTLALTIDAEGKVSDVKAKTLSPLLERSTLDNIREWTFEKPLAAPFMQTIVYDYRIDQSGKANGTKVTFDLPDHVTITAEPLTVQTQTSQLGKQR